MVRIRAPPPPHRVEHTHHQPDGVWMECGWSVDGVWMECGWSVDGVWMECGWSVDGVWMECGWSVDGAWMERTHLHVSQHAGNRGYLRQRRASAQPWVLVHKAEHRVSSAGCCLSGQDGHEPLNLNEHDHGVKGVQRGCNGGVRSVIRETEDVNEVFARRPEQLIRHACPNAAPARSKVQKGKTWTHGGRISEHVGSPENACGGRAPRRAAGAVG